MNNKKNKIVFKNNEKTIKTLYWKDYCEDSDTEISLTNYIEQNSLYFRKKILKVFENIEENNKNFLDYLKIENDFNYWHLTNFVEKNFYKKNKFFQLIKILAVEKISRDLKFNHLYIDLDEKLYEEVLYNFLISKKQNTTINISNFFSSFFLEFINLLKGFFFISQKILNIKKKRIFNKDFNLFISFFSYINQKKFENNQYRSLYWGDISKIVKNNFLHLYIKNNLKYNFNKSNLNLNNISKETEIHNFLDAFLNKKIFFKILFVSIKLKCKFHINKKKFKVKYKNIDITKVLDYDLQRDFLFFNILIKLYYFYLFQNFFEKNYFNKNCFYIFENQPWEKSLIYNWKKKQKGKIFGVINSSVRFWDIRFAKSKISPDFLLVNGEDSLQKLTDFSYDKNKLKVVESLRYENLFKTNNFENQVEGNEVLVLLDYSEKSNKNLIEILNKSEYIKKTNIVLKQHPLKQTNKIDFNFKFKEFDETRSIKYNLIISTNRTNASVDYFLRGMNLAVLLEPDFLNFSPLKGNKECKFFKNYNELDQILKNITNKTSNANPNFYMINSEYSLWKEIFNNYV